MRYLIPRPSFIVLISLFVFFAILSIRPSFGQGDNCGAPIDLGTLSSPYSSTTFGYFDDISICRTGSPDRVFYINVPNGGTIDIWESSNTYDEYEYMGYGATCPGTTTINCWDNDGLAHNTWTNSTGSSQIVWYVQDGYSASSGDFVLNWTLTVPLLPGENCTNPQNLATLTSPYSATTVGYADDISICRTGYPDRIFYIDVPNGSTIDIWESTNSYDEYEYMGYGATCPGSSTITCWDNDALAHNIWTNSTGSTQRVWYIQDGYSGSGTFTLNWTLSSPLLPGENCTNPQNLATLTSPYAATTIGYADDLSICRTGYPDRIFYIAVPNGSSIDIWESTNSYDEYEYMGYGPTCPGSTTITCWDNDGLAHNTWTNSTGSTQTVWYIQDGYSGSGTFTLNWVLNACVTPGTPISLSGSGTSPTSVSFSWAAGSPSGSPTVTYYWSLYTSGGAFVTSGNTTGTSATASGLTCGSSYYFTVYAYTNCNGTSSSTATSGTFNTQACYMFVPSSGNNSYTVCSGNLYDNGGPSGDYNNSWDGYTVIYPSIAGNMVQITGTTSGESCCDYINVYNGVGTGSTPIGTFVASYGALPTLTSSDPTGALTIRFSSDGSVVGAGFNIAIACVSCTTPGTPTAVTGTATGWNTATLSWGAGSPAGTPTITYYYVVGTSPAVTYGSGIIQGSTNATTVNVTGLACGTTYYARVYATTGCNGTSSAYGTSASFTTTTIAAPTPVTANLATICAGASSNLNAVSAGNNINWYTVPSGGTAIGTVASGVNFPVTPGVTTTYYAEAQGGGGTGSGTKYYISSTVGEPWGGTDMIDAMNGVYGAGNWIHAYYETVNVATLLSPATALIWMDGGDIDATEMETFLNANMAAIEAWVSAGGRLILNAAPNEDNGMSYGFGGTTLNYNGTFLPTSAVMINPAHPIFAGPYTPAGATWSATYVAHSYITGSGINGILSGTVGTTETILGDKNWGSGRVLFGGLTYHTWWSPLLESMNLRQNMIYYMNSNIVSCLSPRTPVTVTVNTASTAPTLISGTATICSGMSTTLTASGGTLGTSGTYQWGTGAVVGSNIIAGATSASYTTPALTQTTTYWVRRTDPAPCSTITGGTLITVTVTNPTNTGLTAGDYIWSGNTGTNWNIASNWLTYNGSTFTVAASIPATTSNVFIRDYSSCALNAPVISTATGNCRNLTIEAGKTLTMANGQLLNVYGNWMNYGTFTAGNGSVIFNAAIAQSIRAGGSSFYDVTFNNTTAGTSDVEVTDPMTITHNGVFTNGIAYYSGTGSLTFTNGATSNSGSATSFVNLSGAAVVTKIGTNAFVFPIGEVSGPNIVWAPLGIAAPAANSTITVDYNFSASPNNLDPAYMCSVALLDHTSGVEYWIITTTASTPDVTLYWKDAVRSGITDVPNLVVAHYEPCPLITDPTRWRAMPTVAAGTTGVGGTGSATGSSFISYSPVTFGTKINSNPLPVSLLNINGTCENGKAVLTWTTASETNNSHFDIERSHDLENWDYIGRVDGAGTSNTLLSYSFVDEQPQAYETYYRLKQVDLDGSTSYLDPIILSCASLMADPSVTFYPNPFTTEVIINFFNLTSEEASIVVFDMLGNVVMQDNVDKQTILSHTAKLQLGELSAGVYSIKFTSGAFIATERLVKGL